MSIIDRAKGGAKRVIQRPGSPNEAFILDQISQVTRSLVSYNQRGVASLLNVTAVTVNRMIKRGDLKAYIFGGHWRIPAWAIQEFQERKGQHIKKPDATHMKRADAGRINLAKARAKFKADREHMKRFLDTAESPLPEQPPQNK